MNPSPGTIARNGGAVIPGLSEADLTDAQARRTWAALGHGAWISDALLRPWRQQVEQAGQWQAHTHGGYHPVAVDLTGFWPPRLRGCPTTHYQAAAGNVLPAIPSGHCRRLLREAVTRSAPDDALVVDRESGVALLHEVGATAYVARLPKNFTARRATLPAYGGRGRPPTRCKIVRPLPCQRQGRQIAATPPDQVTTWAEGTTVVRTEAWLALVLPDTHPDSPTFTVIAIHDPRYREPLLLATPLALPPQSVRGLYRDRWPVEQIPLAAKQMLGAARQFVHEPETCQRLPELALIAGAIVSYAAATLPAVPTGFWDRQPRPTPGRLRRVLARRRFPHDFPLPVRLREKRTVTEHLPKGFFGQRRPPAAEPVVKAA